MEVWYNENGFKFSKTKTVCNVEYTFDPVLTIAVYKIPIVE